MLIDILIYSLLGYLSGSVLYSNIYGQMSGIGDLSINSRDHDPGTRNAFINGGKWVGFLTLASDFLKAFVPVFLFRMNCWHATYSIGLSLVMAAPVLGNCFSIFHHFKGTKSPAAAIGVICALLPYWQPLAILAVLYVLFSSVLVIQPYLYQEIAVYAVFMLLCMFLQGALYMNFGCVAAAAIICTKCALSQEEREAFSMEPGWKRQS